MARGRSRGPRNSCPAALRDSDQNSLSAWCRIGKGLFGRRSRTGFVSVSTFLNSYNQAAIIRDFRVLNVLLASALTAVAKHLVSGVVRKLGAQCRVRDYGINPRANGMSPCKQKIRNKIGSNSRTPARPPAQKSKQLLPPPADNGWPARGIIFALGWAQHPATSPSLRQFHCIASSRSSSETVAKLVA